MATRNRTLVFIQYRNEKKSFRGSGNGVGTPMKKGYSELGQSLISKKDVELDEIESGTIDTSKKSLSLPPGWMNIIDDVHYDIGRIKAKMEELAESHKNHLLPQFGPDDKIDEEQTIEILTENITRMFQAAQGKVQKLGSVPLHKQEESVRKNLQSQLASQLQELSVSFRKTQKDYLQRLKGRQQKGKKLPVDDEDDGREARFEGGFTEGQSHKTVQAEIMVEQREKEILQIAKSINDLAAIFKDLSTLVIEQGTILDRIDFNIEQTSHNTKEGVKQLVQAQNQQKGYRNKLIMLLLCIGVLVMLAVVLLKGFVFK